MNLMYMCHHDSSCFIGGVCAMSLEGVPKFQHHRRTASTFLTTYALLASTVNHQLVLKNQTERLGSHFSCQVLPCISTLVG